MDTIAKLTVIAGIALVANQSGLLKSVEPHIDDALDEFLSPFNLGNDVYLSQHFKLSEFTRSATADRYGLDNTPSPEVIARLKLLCDHVLEPARVHFGRPIKVTSGYRSNAVNSHPSVGGVSDSQHLTGEAADVELIGGSNDELASYIGRNLIYDQLIREYPVAGVPDSGWVHVSFSPFQNRQQALLKTRGVRGFQPLTFT